MPNYYWTGVDLQGSSRSGYMRALSVNELEEYLVERDIGLLSASPKKAFFSRVQERDILFFFERLNVLLHSGVLLPHGLKIIARKVRSSRLAHIIEEAQMSVERGIFFHDALAAYPDVFDQLTLHLWRVGSGGDLKGAVVLLCDYVRERHAMKQKLRRAAFMPILSIGFFVAIFLGVLLFIIPRFGDMFETLKIAVPSSTQWLLSLSANVQSVQALLWLGALFGIGLAVYNAMRLVKIKSFIDRLLLKIPYVGSYIIERDLCFFFNALALLVQAGVQVVPAMEVVLNVIQNRKIHEQIAALGVQIQSGSSMSGALEEISFVDDEIIALVTVGQHSGKFGLLLKEVGIMLHERMNKRIDFLLHVLQPVLIMMLALMIVGLMLSVYMPIFTLSNNMV